MKPTKRKQLTNQLDEEIWRPIRRRTRANVETDLWYDIMGRIQEPVRKHLGKSIVGVLVDCLSKPR